jgi:mono/diheme cytochrome c family protein
VPGSRRRVAIVASSVFLLLDLGRSAYTRWAGTTPIHIGPADQGYAAAIPWPPGKGVPSGAPLGQRIYAAHCAVCHGPNGHGNGPASPSLRPRPRDFTGGVFKIKSTPDSEPPTLEDVRRTIKLGMPGSSMPSWVDILGETEIDAVAEYVRDFGSQPQWSASTNMPLVSAQVLAAASAEQGRQLYGDLGCASCHGAQGRGDGPSAKDLKDVWKQADRPRDLTAPWTFRGGSSADAVYARIAYGIGGTPMPSYADVAQPADIASVVAYVRSIARPAAWEPGGALDGPGQSPDPLRRGEYLVHAGMCGLCHTPVDPAGIYLSDTHYLAGGMKIEAGAHGVLFSRNLTPDAESGLGTWSVEQIATAIRTGRTPDRRLNYWGMPWMVLGALSDEDARAIATYLKSLPAVHNQVPHPLHYGFVETVARKLTYGWPALMPQRLAYYAGNFGYEQPVRLPRDLPPRVLIGMQYLTIAVGLILWVMTPRQPAALGGPHRGVAMIFGMLALGLGAAMLIIYRYPAVDRLPAGVVVSAFTSSIPQAKTDGLPAQQAALVERGRYLYTIGSCAYCHGGDGSGGGKMNWRAFGTTWTRNLTSQPTGLGGWSDAAVLRAMISGISRDGRPLHWQAMIWDHVSNYSVEDQHALLAYLRSLPPVERTLPAPVAPGPNDCSGDTFWIGRTNFEAGCAE